MPHGVADRAACAGHHLWGQVVYMSFLAPPFLAAHQTNVDGAWIRPKVPKQLRAGSVLRFGASTREYRVARLPAPPQRR